MDLAVIIPARNEEDRLGAQLDALIAQEWPGQWEIVVVDNGSTDGTAASFATTPPDHHGLGTDSPLTLRTSLLRPTQA